MMVKNKVCTKCHKSRRLISFNKKKQAKDGLEPWCRSCTKLSSKIYRDLNPETMAALKKSWKSTNIDREKRNNKGHNLTKYWTDLTPTEALKAYDDLLLKQDNKCKICERHELEFQSRFHVDHCHETNRIRGLLCFNCNVMLGNSLDNAETLKNAVKYLEVNV